ncbi:efflux RND transporter periplasmic adaptor subunit [Persephonella sp. IF05-L8]|uniref:efflux RND transporter periplasmic adaptor subunit n=1 Tax=Persephonella sp. IF05-L8 TaxID=1158338 RepID=UPI0004957C1E
MRNKVITLVFLLLFFGTYAQEKIKLSPEMIKDIGIATISIKKQTITIDKSYPGIVKDDLNLSQKVYSPVEGIVYKLFVIEGDFVKKGQKLAEIQSPQITQLQAELYMAKVELENARKLYEREKELYEKKVIPYSRYFSAKIKYENLLGKVKALKKSLKAYGEVKDGKLILRSNINGFVARQNVVIGESVGPDKEIYKLHEHDKLWVVAFIPLTDITLFKKGLKVKVKSPLGTTEGIVKIIGHHIDPKTKRNPVRIISYNQDDILKPQMYVDVLLSLKLPPSLYIPASAVVFHGNETYAFVYENGYFYPVKIQIGKRVGNYYHLIAGLKEGTEVVYKGTLHLKSRFFGEAEEE